MTVDNEVLSAFYQRLYPFKILFEWLNHSHVPSKAFGNRELAFTLSNDAYLRYQSFPTADALKKEVVRLVPSRFEIGPVYSANPRDRKTLRKAAFRPIEKELVFDIDLTDYDAIRACCSGTDICHKCWQYITFAIRTMDIALRDDFGFKHVLWVYSGRRGAHAWVSDKSARELDDTKRRAIATYLEVIKGKNAVDVRRPLHPSIARSLDTLKISFKDDVLDMQEPWLDTKGYEKLLERIPDAELRDALRKKWTTQSHRSSASKWADIDSLAESGVSKTLKTKELQVAKQNIILEYAYPRLDVEVSKHLNHLLKAPFCVHPGTNRVCVPIDANRPEAFDPFGVPKVGDLLKEIDSWDAAHPEEIDESDSKVPGKANTVR